MRGSRCDGARRPRCLACRGRTLSWQFYTTQGFAVPGVFVVQTAQSTLALSVSLPFGLRQIDSSIEFESLAVSAVPSTRLTGMAKPGSIAAVIPVAPLA